MIATLIMLAAWLPDMQYVQGHSTDSGVISVAELQQNGKMVEMIQQDKNQFINEDLSKTNSDYVDPISLRKNI